MVVCYVDSDDAGAVGGLVFGAENGNSKSGVHYYRNYHQLNKGTSINYIR